MKLENRPECAPNVEPKNKLSIYPIKISGLLTTIALLMLPFLLGSCEAIGGIFKAGMGFGIFLVVAVIITIVVIVTRMGRNKNS